MHKQLLTSTLWAVEESKMQSHSLQNFCLVSCGMEYPFGPFKSAVLMLLPPSSLDPLLWTALA